MHHKATLEHRQNQRRPFYRAASHARPDLPITPWPNLTLPQLHGTRKEVSCSPIIECCIIWMASEYQTKNRTVNVKIFVRYSDVLDFWEYWTYRSGIKMFQVFVWPMFRSPPYIQEGLTNCTLQIHLNTRLFSVQCLNNKHSVLDNGVCVNFHLLFEWKNAWILVILPFKNCTFTNRTCLDHLNTGHVWYSDHSCVII